MIASLMLALAQAPAATPELQAMPPLEQAQGQIEALDGKLFWAAFEGCDPPAIEEVLTEDFRMLHDLAGLAVSGRTQFVEELEQQCASRGETGYRNRRLVTPGSRTITPLGDWGMLERGWHTFHELRQRPAGSYGEDDPGGPSWVQTGGAQYIHVWRWIGEEGRFRLTESISVDHGPAVKYPPATE